MRFSCGPARFKPETEIRDSEWHSREGVDYVIRDSRFEMRSGEGYEIRTDSCRMDPSHTAWASLTIDNIYGLTWPDPLSFVACFLNPSRYPAPPATTSITRFIKVVSIETTRWLISEQLIYSVASRLAYWSWASYSSQYSRAKMQQQS